jgi:aspartate kinase
MGLSVAKFGGSSLSTEQKVRWAAKVVAADEDRRITVVSAAGTSEEHQIKLTDDCYSLAAESDTVLMTQKTGAIIERYQAIYPDQKMDKIKKDLESRLGVSFPTRALRTEAIAAWGDEAQAKLFAELTGRTYVDPANFLRVAEVRGRIVVLPKSYDMMQTYFREG